MLSRRILPFENLVVMRFELDYFVNVQIGNTTSILYDVIIANQFRLTNDEETLTLSPAHLPELGPLLRLFMQQIRSAYYEDDVLQIEFVNGAHIVVEPHPDYEAWNIFSASAESPEQVAIFARLRAPNSA